MPSQHDTNRIRIGGARLFQEEIDGLDVLVRVGEFRDRTHLLQVLSRHPLAVAKLLRELESSSTTEAP